MKKRVSKKRLFLKILVALTVLSSMLVSTLFGVSKAEYFKSLSKKLDFEASPDLALEYYLYDATGTGSSAFKESKGVYKNPKSFSQKVVVGKYKQYIMDAYGTTEWNADLTKDQLDKNKYPDAYATTTDVLNLTNFEFCGEGIIYQIKLPVNEAGYYVLNFQVDFELSLPNDKWANEISDFFTQTYDRAIGCEILNYNDGFTFGDSSKYLDLYSRSGNDSVYGTSEKASADKENVKYFEADSLYQWKTLSPSRAENVSLAFKVEPEDVKNGYVIWMWDFAGLFGARTWRLNFADVSVEKTMELDGSTAYRDGNTDPYFMFPQTTFVNNQHVLSTVDLSNRDIYDYPVDTSVRGVRARGKTSYSKGRGTFATSATANSLTFQAESIFYGFGNNDSNWGGGGLKYNGMGYLNELDGTPAWSNPVVASIPLKNIQFDTDYKVTFDLSVARQGTYTVSNDGEGDASFLNASYFNGIDYNNRALPLVEYADPTSDLVFRKGTKLFSSYLLSGDGDRRTETTHKENMQQIKYADKSYQGEPLTKYDEINSLTTLNRSIVQSVNNTYCNENANTSTSASTQSRNWFNAVCHTEYNGQNKINWLTFYNTTFTFNIDGSDDNNKEKLKLDEYGYIKDLNWVWAMDSLISGCYYRIKLENVRIEKVVKYTSSLNNNGVKIAGSQIDLTNYAVAYNSESLGYRDEDENNIFYSLRGINGTGQQYQARGFVLEEIAGGNRVFTSEGNIYAPIIDATKFIVRPNDPNGTVDANGELPPTADAYKIELSGFAVCQGGVAKYVFSIDGGQTWQDMTFNGSYAQVDQLTAAEKGVNQYMSGTKRYSESDFTNVSKDIKDFTHIDFTVDDAANGSFNDFTLVADLTKYKNEANLDIIIAAVPASDTELRCEILRIINFNQIRNYVNFPYDFVSDIAVNKDGDSSLLNAFRLDESHLPDNKKPHYHNGLANPEAIGFTMTKTYSLREKGAQSTTSYARMGAISYDYEDIKTAFSDFPIYNELSITGWAIVEGGVQDYYWSADHGKTWTKCSGTAVKYTNADNYDLISPSYAEHYYSELGKKDPTIGKEKHRFEDSMDGKFNGSKLSETGTKLTANLSNYAGQVVDVIFAAKPNESDVYVPVGRIDNVAVYGETGTFYTHINSLTIDGQIIDPTYFDVDNEPLNHVTSGGTVAPQWNLDYTEIDGEEFSYTIFEPNNVNAMNARLYNNKLNVVQSGSQIVINGYTAIGGAAHDNEYMYTLDGGDTWNKIYLKSNAEPTDAFKAYAKLSDSSITNFKSANYYDDSTGNLTFAIPALPDGAVRNLTVVAKNAEGNIVPVLNIKLKIKNENTGFFVSDANGVQTGYYGNKSISQSITTKADPAETSYKLTFPVEREGVHTLTFNSQINVNPVTTNNDNYEVGGHIVYGWSNEDTSDPYYPGWEFGTGTASMSIPKTNYTVGETLRVSCNWNVTNSKSSPESAIREPWIGIVKVKDDGTFEHINPENIDLNNDYPPYVKPINKNSHEAANYSETVEIPNLPAGEYKVIFANYWTVSRWVHSLKSAPDNGKNAEFHYLAEPIDITVKDKFTVTATIVHDDVEQKGGERYYASTSNTPYNADSIAAWEIDNPFAASDVDLYFNATAEDVRRGYVVLDWDLSELTKNASYTLTIKNLMYSYGVKSTKHLTTDANGDASYTIKVPALDVGTHEFAFLSYTSAYTPIIHNGINQTVVAGNSNRKYGGNYLAAGAYMSVQKNVYTVGEPIHVSYNTAGAGTSLNANPSNSPWIGITRAVEGRDVIVGRVFLEKNTVGALTFKSGLDGCETVTESFANLPAGDYKLYFRDDSALIYGDMGTDPNKPDNLGEYWPQMNITDPIAITIIDPNRKNDNPYKLTYSFDDVRYDWTSGSNFTSGVSGYISLDKTVFRVGEDITFNYHKSEAFGNPLRAETIYIGFAEPNYTGNTFLDTPGVYFGNLEDRKIDIPDDIAPGRYQLYCCDYGFAEARQKGSVIAVIDIVILPADGEDLPTMDLTYAHQSGNSALNYNYTSISAYDYSRNPISIDVTEADVERGYVEFKYELNDLVPNMDIVYTTEMFYNRKIEEVPYIEDGNYIYFGEYPQTLKLPSVEILENVALDYRGYYKGSDGYYYAKVVADPYGDDYIFANGNNYVVEGETYYFKVESIKWRILKTSNGYYDLLCESIIDNRAYDNDSNKYDVSDVRKWLNETFYKTAFSDFQKEYILQTEVDNSPESTGYASNNYSCENTNDKVYLPSYADVTNTEYGFSDNEYEFDLNRIKTVTDYARATGAWINMSEWDGNMGSGIWMLRSPADSSNIFIREGYYVGDVTDGGINISSTAHGVVPMLRLSELTESTTSVSLETIVTSDFEITKGAIGSKKSTYPNVSISVPKTYYEYGEAIPVEYNLTGLTSPRIVITADSKGTENRYGDVPVKRVQLSTNESGTIPNMGAATYTVATFDAKYYESTDKAYWDTLPPGEYKIWIFNDTDNGTTYHQYTNGSGAVTEGISIKILPQDELNPDFSVTHYSDWEYKGTTYDDPVRLNWTSLTLDKNVFKKGEKIRYYIDGSWEHKWVGVFDAETFSMNCDIVENYPEYRKTLRYAQWGHKDYINAGSNYLETGTLEPGQYKVVYAFGKNLEGAWGHTAFGGDHGNTSQKVMTVIDITILPEDCGDQIVTVNYTKTDGTAGEKTLVKPIEFFTPVKFNTFLNSVLPESPIEIETDISGYDDPVEIIRTNVSIINYGDD